MDSLECDFLEWDSDDKTGTFDIATAPNFTIVFDEIMQEAGHDDDPETVDHCVVQSQGDVEVTPTILQQTIPDLLHYGRTTPNKKHVLSSNSAETVLNHLIEILAEDQPNDIVADSANIYTPTIARIGSAEISHLLLHSLDQEVRHLYSTGVLDFHALRLLDDAKASKYRSAGVYMHVIYNPFHPNVY